MRLKLGQNAEAEEDCSSALELDGDNVKALLRRGLARTELGKLDEALADYREALRLEPANAQAAKAMLKLEGLNGGMFVDSEAAAGSPSEAK